MWFLVEGLISPRVKPGIGATGGLFPFFFRGQAFANLLTVGFSLIPGYVGDRVSPRAFPETMV